MKEHDRTVLRVTEGTVRVKRDGISLDMKRFEAMAMKQIETALAGSPHAQRAVLAAHERASKLRDAENAASCELWTSVLAANDKAAACATAAGLSTAAILPKRCDVLFDGPDGVRVIGPYDAESAKRFDGVVRLRDAFFASSLWKTPAMAYRASIDHQRAPGSCLRCSITTLCRQACSFRRPTNCSVSVTFTRYQRESS